VETLVYGHHISQYSSDMFIPINKFMPWTGTWLASSLVQLSPESILHVAQ